ncbi:hypothetical protein [Massilia genomosp. 1]|uniref:hypothetical protein n=1 Tax=Massilia genomosp. 1 TaxID=2609280 RepID=UPI001E378B97|nr:hypothetical protein [Massilia genomosp. 1]
MFSLTRLSPSVTDMIRFDHSHVLVTFHQYTTASRAGVKKALAETIQGSPQRIGRADDQAPFATA